MIYLEKTRKRFSKFTKKKKSGCIEFTGFVCPTAGYGKFSYKNKAISSHRMSWILEKGEIPDKKVICHTCDNRKCVNIKHLFLGTYKDNALDAKSKKRNPRHENHGSAKLTLAEVKEIRYLRSMGMYGTSLSELYDVSFVNIYDICNGKIWVD